MRHLSFLILLSAFVVSCSTSGDALKTSVPADADEILVDASGSRAVGNPVYIRNAEIINDHLVLSVSYSGGCEDHSFALNTRGDFSATYPPELKITFWHDAHGDRCRSMIDKKLWYDLTPVQYPGTNRVLLILTNTDKTITYTY